MNAAAFQTSAQRIYDFVRRHFESHVAAGEDRSERYWDALAAMLSHEIGVSRQVITAPERVMAAAIREGGVVYTAPHHAQIIHYLVPLLGIRRVSGEQGFITSHNRFVSRAEAARVALAAGQTTKNEGSLFSEQLWIVPDYVFVPGSERSPASKRDSGPS